MSSEPAQTEEDKTKSAASTMNNDELIQRADEEIAESRLLVAARLLKQVQNGGQHELLTDLHKSVIAKAKMIQDVIDLHLEPPTTVDSEWKKQGESHGNRATVIYYKVEGHSQLTCRIETPIESSLLVPLLAVMNESELYDTWMPRFTFPFRMGVRKAQKLKEQPALGRGAQIVQVTVDMPFPVADREVVYDTWAVDAIDELGLISMKGVSLDVGAENGLVQPPEPGIKRIDFDAGFVIRRCPDDHPCLQTMNENSTSELAEGEHLLLLSLTQYVDAHVGWVPQSLINFSTRTALSGQWGSLLQVAQDVKEGNRPDHAKCIQEKKQLYGWVNERIDAMFAKLSKDVQQQEEQ